MATILNFSEVHAFKTTGLISITFSPSFVVFRALLFKLNMYFSERFPINDLIPGLLVVTIFTLSVVLFTTH